MNRSNRLLISISFALGSWFLKLLLWPRNQRFLHVSVDVVWYALVQGIWFVKCSVTVSHIWCYCFGVYFQFPLLSYVHIYYLGSIWLFAFGHLQPFRNTKHSMYGCCSSKHKYKYIICYAGKHEQQQ